MYLPFGPRNCGDGKEDISGEGRQTCELLTTVFHPIPTSLESTSWGAGFKASKKLWSRPGGE